MIDCPVRSTSKHLEQCDASWCSWVRHHMGSLACSLSPCKITHLTKLCYVCQVSDTLSLGVQEILIKLYTAMQSAASIALFSSITHLIFFTSPPLYVQAEAWKPDEDEMPGGHQVFTGHTNTLLASTVLFRGWSRIFASGGVGSAYRTCAANSAIQSNPLLTMSICNKHPIAITGNCCKCTMQQR